MLKVLLKKLVGDEDGAIMTEYALLVVLIALVVVLLVSEIGKSVMGFFESFTNEFSE